MFSIKKVNYHLQINSNFKPHYLNISEPFYYLKKQTDRGNFSQTIE